MKLIFYYDIEGAGNPYFKYIYNTIFEQFKYKYPDYTVVHEQPDYEKLGNSFSSPGGKSNLQIINPLNNNIILMSFWDRGMDLLTEKGIGWEKYNLVQYIGGLGMRLNSQQIKEKYGVTHLPFQYPLGVPNSYEYVDEFYKPFNPDEKIKKAVFIGAIYGTRAEICYRMKNHPLIDIFDNTAGYIGREYFKKLSEYLISISFNGNGELCLRDFESMGLNIPVVRPGLLTELHNPLIPDYHYIKATEPCENAHFSHRNTNINDLSNQYINSIETSINDYDKLLKITNNAHEYFESYCKPDYIIDLFFKLLNIKLII